LILSSLTTVADPIHDAAYDGDIDTVLSELDNGVDINSTNALKRTPVHQAVFGNQIGLIELLISKGADLTLKDVSNMTPLDFASHKGPLTHIPDSIPDPKIAEILLKNGAKYGSIHTATTYGEVRDVEGFLEDDVDVNSKDRIGHTPIILASIRGHVGIAQLLINNKAAIGKVGGHPGGSLHYAAAYGHLDVAQLLLKSGADINAQDAGKMTPFHEAVMWYKSLDLVKFLFSAGANLNLENMDGYTPLDSALIRLNPYPELINYLIVNGAKHSTIHTASTYGSIQSVVDFLNSGTDVNAKNRYDRTPLHEAALMGRIQLLSVLITRKANVNALDMNGKSPMDLAIQMKQTEAIKFLREQGGRTGNEIDLMPHLNFFSMPFGFTFKSVKGVKYIIESGTSIGKWDKLREIEGTGDEVRFVDVRRIYFPKHFYRVVVED
jgi:ankyrin repeat protein